MSRIRPVRLSRRENALVASAQAATLFLAAERMDDAADDGVVDIKTGPQAVRWAAQHCDRLANDAMRRSRFRRKGAK
jgi:hypothetical protein